MMQVSIALLGHLRGGAAKVAVVSSALNGVVSGSSVSNVVSGGIFTIPLMKRSGLSGVKAGAIEASSSINGQIMPPVMGAAAFLMVEYVGIPYSEIIKHAALPAIASYIALYLHRASGGSENRLDADRAGQSRRCEDAAHSERVRNQRHVIVRCARSTTGSKARELHSAKRGLAIGRGRNSRFTCSPSGMPRAIRILRSTTQTHRSCICPWLGTGAKREWIS